MRVLRKIAVGFSKFSAVVVVLLVLLYSEKDWRGARAWAQCQKDFAARGK